MAFEHELASGMIHTVEVVGIDPCKTSFQTSKGERAGETQYCHYIKVTHLNYAEPFDVQICNYESGVKNFEVGDTIKVKAGTFNKTANIQTVKFECRVFKSEDKKTKQAVAALQSPDSVVKKESGPIKGEVNTNPQIHGTIYSKSMSDACALFAGNPLMTTQKVFDAADEIVAWYQKKLGL